MEQTAERPPRPKCTRRGVRALWSAGRWKFRAACRVNGWTRVGPYRLTQNEAYKDYVELREDGLSMIRPDSVLSGAFARLMFDAEKRGQTREYVDGHIGSVARAILRIIPGTTQLRHISVDTLTEYVVVAKEAGRHVNTIIAKDLQLISRLFRIAGLKNQVSALKREMPTLRMQRTIKPVLDAAKVTHLIERIRISQLPLAQYHADLFTIVAYTGIRAGELSRVLPEHIDVEKATLSVVLAKDRCNPRVLPVPQVALPALKRLKGCDNCRPPGKSIVSSMNYLATMVSRWQKRLGEGLWNLRGLRRAYCSTLLNEGVPTVRVRELMGHLHLATTDRYAVAHEKARSDVERVFR